MENLNTMNSIDAMNVENRELSIDELDGTSGGFLWIGVVVGAFAAGTLIRMGFDRVVSHLK